MLVHHKYLIINDISIVCIFGNTDFSLYLCNAIYRLKSVLRKRRLNGKRYNFQINTSSNSQIIFLFLIFGIVFEIFLSVNP
jgi:hypothetical protein